MAGLISLGISSGPLPTAPGLEIGQVSQPNNIPGAVPATAEDMRMIEAGATGTPIFSGFLRELGEYVPDLTWPSAYMVYERMRRSDSQVAATLMAIKLPIRCAEWNMHVPDDASPVEKEAAAFCDKCLREDMDFDSIIDNALLMLDFGASMSEDVYVIDGNRVKLLKVAPRLPLTFYRWITKPGTDELIIIQQLGYRAGQYILTDVPVEKASLFTFQQEGANFVGRSLLRPMYQHWYIKSNLYKIDAIAAERNGMGVPTITLGDQVKQEDRDAALKWVQQLSTHERTGIVIPKGWTFSLEGVKGTIRDSKDSIVHHNMQISMAGLAQFMVMGQSHSSSGNRSLGQTMSDFFYLSLQGTANHIARVITQTTIKRLVDFNFPGVVNYPRLIPQQILSVNFQDVVEALKGLANSQVDAVRPDDELEKWIRQKIGAPKAGEPRLRVAAPLPQPGADEPTEGDTDPNDDATTPPPEKKPAKKAPKPPVSASTRREPRGPEKFLAADEIIRGLDKGRDDVAAALRKAKPRVQAEVIHKLVDAPVRNMHRVSVAPDPDLVAEVEEILRGLADFGTKQVGDERDRQLAGKKPADAAQVRLAGADRRDAIGLYADGVVGEFTNNIQQRATNIALDQQRQGAKTKGQLITDIGDDLDDQSDKWIDNVASKGANEAFADGRQDGYEQYKDEISQVIYSAMLDINTCGQCADADGQQGDTPDDIPDVPNPDCDGGDKCRCVHVYVFNDEEASAK